MDVMNCKCLGEAAAAEVNIQTKYHEVQKSCRIGWTEPVEEHEHDCCRLTSPAIGAGGASNSWLEHTRNANLNKDDSSSDCLNLSGGSMIKMQSDDKNTVEVHLQSSEWSLVFKANGRLQTG